VQCTTNTQCPSGQICDGTNKCVPAPDAGPVDAGPPKDAFGIEGGGCDCRTAPGENPVKELPGVAVLGLATILLRRRRRPSATT